MTASRPFTPETLSAPQDVNEAIRIIRELLGDAPCWRTPCSTAP